MTGAMDQLSTLRRFLAAVAGHVSQAELHEAQAIVSRAEQRLALSMEHTVVALAGATGSGKSSIFNAIAGCDLSPVSVRRPTTSVAHACFWGTDRVQPLLDWLDVAPNRRFDLDTMPGRRAEYRAEGLVLLDLPDFDSVDETHHAEVQRLLDLVDQVIWVLDPQKYADKTLHEQYLRAAAPYREVTVVVLNQNDTLSGADSLRCVDDLRQLLEADGLAGVGILPTSTVESDGLLPLVAHLEKISSSREIPERRLACAIRDATARLAPLVAIEVSEDRVDRTVVGPVVDSLAEAAGVPAILDSIEPAYIRRARLVTGWPLARMFRWIRPDPRRRLSLPEQQTSQPSTSSTGDSLSAAELVQAASGESAGSECTPVPETAAGQRAAAALAARELAAQATAGMPDPWPALAQAAALANEPSVPRALEEAIARVTVGFGQRPRWWTWIRVAHWISTALVVCCLVWLVAIGFVQGLGGWAIPAVGVVVGALVGAALSAAVRPLVRVSARRARAKAQLRLRVGVAEVASDLIVVPVREVLRTYTNARAALDGQ